MKFNEAMALAELEIKYRIAAMRCDNKALDEISLEMRKLESDIRLGRFRPEGFEFAIAA